MGVADPLPGYSNLREDEGSSGEACCCPNAAIYVISSKCATVNNGACPGWAFCGFRCPGTSPDSTTRKGGND